MNAFKLIEDIKEKYSEWLEHEENPNDFITRVLATQIVQLIEYNEYLEKRLEHVNSNTTTNR